MTEYKNNPFLLSLRQPTRHPNGKHRRTSPKAHSSPVVGTDPGSRGSDQTAVYVSRRTPIPPSTWRTYSSGVRANSLSLFQYSQMLVDIYADSKPPTIPYAGVRVGEIIGYRYWTIEDGGLGSVAHDFIWQPGKTIEGDINELITRGVRFDVYGGVYAFSTKDKLEDEIVDTRNVIVPINTLTTVVYGFAIGTISMWGEVVEHQHGYRAQFAKVRSIDEVIGCPERLEELRERYGV